MARTGLRMMPTFPSPPLSFRTAGFPQYGWKAGYQVKPSRALLRLSLLPAYPSRHAVCHHPSCSPWRLVHPCSVSRTCARWSTAMRATFSLYPRGPRSEPGYAVPVHQRLSAPSASLAGTRRLHGPAAYTPRLRCAGAPRRPARPSLLSLSRCPCVPSTLRRWVRGPFPLCRDRDARLPRPITESPPTRARLCQQFPTGFEISALHRSRHAAARMFARPSGLARTRCNHMSCTSPSEDRVTPAFDGVRRRAPLGVRLEGRTGNFPSSGLSPDQFTTGSEAAR